MNIKIPPKLLALLEKIDDKNIHYVLGGAIVVILVLDIFLLMWPQMQAINKINPKIKTLSEDLKAARDNIQKSSFYTKENEKFKTKFEGISARIKSKEEAPLILERISRLANKNGVKIDQMTPNLQNQKQLLKEKERIYFALPIEIEAKSEYHSFGRFLNQIEANDLILIVDKFTVASVTESKQHQIKLTLNAVVFDQKKELK